MRNLSKNCEMQKRVSGFTLIEMMIAVTIGLFILGAVSAVAINSARSSRANDRTSELQSNGRYALDVLRRDIQHAGQSGMTPSSTLLTAKTQGFFSIASGVAVTGDCANGFALKLEEPITGADDPAATPYPGCLTTANIARGDVLTVRYADMSNLWPVNAATPTVAPAAAANNDIYFRSSYSTSALFQKGGTAPTALGTGPMQDQLMMTHVYYISPNTSGNDGIPALYRVSLIAGAMTPELVVSGIENLQVQYGVVFNPSTGITQYFDANNVADWTLVQSVRIWILARNSGNERGEAYSNQTTYQMGNASYVPTVNTNDQYRRQLYMTTVQMRN